MGSSSNDLTTLIDRVRAATGADRELDAALWLAFEPGATRRQSTVKSSKGLWPDYEIDETRDRTGRLVIVPDLTASLDAALALVERCGENPERIMNKAIGRTYEWVDSVPDYRQRLTLAVLSTLLLALETQHDR